MTLALVLALLALLVQVLEFLHVPFMQLQRLTLSYIATGSLHVPPRLCFSLSASAPLLGVFVCARASSPRIACTGAPSVFDTRTCLLLALCGSLFFLLLVPFGFERYICLAILHAQHTINAESDTSEDQQATQFEVEAPSWAGWREHQVPHARHARAHSKHAPPHATAIRQPLQQTGKDTAPMHERSAACGMMLPYASHLENDAVEAVVAESCSMSWLSWWARPVSRLYVLGRVVVRHSCALALVLVSIALPATVLLRVVVYSLFGSQSQLPLSLVLSNCAVPVLLRDVLFASLDCVLVTYVWKATWRGVDSLPFLSAWYQRQSSRVLTVRELCLHCLVYLCVGTSFPVITCTLGLTQIQVRDEVHRGERCCRCNGCNGFTQILVHRGEMRVGVDVT